MGFQQGFDDKFGFKHSSSRGTRNLIKYFLKIAHCCGHGLQIRAIGYFLGVGFGFGVKCCRVFNKVLMINLVFSHSYHSEERGISSSISLKLLIVAGTDYKSALSGLDKCFAVCESYSNKVLKILV
jgi:hypothetical protein